MSNRVRSSITGRFVPKKEAKVYPDATVVEKVKVGPIKHREKQSQHFLKPREFIYGCSQDRLSCTCKTRHKHFVSFYVTSSYWDNMQTPQPLYCLDLRVPTNTLYTPTSGLNQSAPFLDVSSILTKSLIYQSTKANNTASPVNI